MKRYEIVVQKNDLKYIATLKQLSLLIGVGEDEDEAIKDLEKTFEEYKTKLEAKGLEIPKPKSYSKRRNLSWSDEVHKVAVKNAKKKGLSVSAYIAKLILEKEE